jgi:hypothetical protein
LWRHEIISSQLNAFTIRDLRFTRRPNFRKAVMETRIKAPPAKSRKTATECVNRKFKGGTLVAGLPCRDILPWHMSDWALVTGASCGIGAELAKVFAAHRFNLVLVARNEARLNQLAGELRAKHGIQVKVLPKDLSSMTAAREIYDALRETPISILVNNAGFGVFGPFARNGLQAQTEMMQVNMTALVQLTHSLVQPMLARGAGRILNVASTAAFQPGPMINIYYATKAFVYSFSCALAEELKGTGITVTTLCPGTTRTGFFARAQMRIARGWPMMEARTVAEIGYRGLMNGKRVVIPGAANKIASALAKRAPARLTSAIVARIHRSGD